MRSEITDRFLERQRAKTFPYTICLFGLEIRVDNGVYPPSEDSTILAEELERGHYAIQPGELVLDFGTGTGYFALVAARKGGRVIAVDCNPAAVRCAASNAQRNGLADGIEFREGSFETLMPGERYQAVAASLPFESAEPKDELERSVYDRDFEMRRAFFRAIRGHLAERGRILFAYADYAERTAPLADFISGFSSRLIAERESRDGEQNRVYLITSELPPTTS